MSQLDTKTVYSFMDSLISIKKYVKKAKELGYQHLGMMDVDNLYGAFSFLEEAKAQGLQPVLGLEVDLLYQEESYNLRFLALNTEGYRNLMKLSSLKMTGKKGWEDMTHLLDGLALIVPYYEGIENLDLPADFYIGVFPDTPKKSFLRPVLPLHTVRYFGQADLETLQMLQAIKQNCSLNEVGPLPSQEFLLSPERFAAAFADTYPQSLKQLDQLLSGISYDINSQLKLPRFNPEREAVEELKERAEAGLAAKGLTGASYQERLAEELAVIHQMGFDDYFLIVWDLLRFGRSQGYYMGMGRGSAVGSLVAYALEITGIDPVENNLLFERFLNLERYTMPDI